MPSTSHSFLYQIINEKCQVKKLTSLLAIQKTNSFYKILWKIRSQYLVIYFITIIYNIKWKVEKFWNITQEKIEQTKNYTNCTIYNLSIQINWQLYTYSMMLEMTQFAMYKHFSSCYGKFN